jgi:DNA-3-methyladenine glycosylase II
MFLIFTLGREDVFSYGDLGLKKGFSKLYKTDKPTQDQIEIIVSKWKPYTTYGSITLWHILDSEVVETSKKLRK